MLTIEELADYYKLPVEVLCRNGFRQGAEGVEVQHYNRDGQKAAIHIRRRIERDGPGPRWIWSGGGPQRLWFPRTMNQDEHIALDSAVVFESELDAVIAWRTGIYAHASAGADMFKANWWQDLPFKRVAVWLEPNGSKLLQKMATTRPSDGPELLVCYSLDDGKDPGHIRRACNGDDNLTHSDLQAVISEARPVTIVAKDTLLAALDELFHVSPNANGQRSLNCPFCGDTTKSAGYAEGGFCCHRDSCGLKMSLPVFAAHMGLVGNSERRPKAESSSLSLIQNDNDDSAPPLSKLGFVRFADLAKPGPRRWIWEGRVPDKAPTVLYGDGGLAKSYFAQLMANYIARGEMLLGSPVLQGKVLYIDYELEVEEQTRRAYMIAAGIGLQTPPQDIYYLRPDQPLSEFIPQLRDTIQPEGIVLVIIDSFGLAMCGDPTAARDVIPIIGAVNSLPCASLIIDHSRNPQMGETAADLSPFGSVYKRHLSRSVLQVIRADGDDVSLSVVIRPTKANFSALAMPLALRVIFEEDKVAFEQSEIVATDFVNAASPLPSSERVLKALIARSEATAAELAKDTDLGVGTVKNNLTELRRVQKAEPVGHGKWRPTESSLSLSYSDNDSDDGREASSPLPASVHNNGSEVPSDADILHAFDGGHNITNISQTHGWDEDWLRERLAILVEEGVMRHDGADRYEVVT